MKRTHFIFILLASLMLSFSAPSATAAVKAGTACKKFGDTTIDSKLKYKCIKSKNKLVWSKGVKVVPPKALSEHEKVVNQIGSLWAQWREKSTSSYVPLKLIIQPGFDSSWQSAIKPANTLISTFVGNGYKLLPEPISIFGDTQEWLATTGRPIACGRSVPEQKMGIYCGHIQMAYAYFALNIEDPEKFEGRKLTPTQIETIKYLVAHDVATMFELQAQYGDLAYNGSKNQIPAWIREGFVQLFAALAISDQNSQKLNYFDYIASAKLIDQFPTKLCIKTLQGFESKDRNWGGSCASSQNFYAVELLVARHGGFEALFNFVTLYGISDNWTESFNSAFGISREEFYTEWYKYLKIPKSEWPALTPAAVPSHN